MTDTHTSAGWWKHPSEFLIRAAAAAGLGVSLLLLWEATHTGAQFCGPGGGCDVVQDSSWAKPLGIPMPVFGVLYFAVALLLVHLRGMRKRLAVLSAVGGVGGIALITIQAVSIKAFCPYCLVADGSAIVLALTALALRNTEPVDSRSGLYVPLVFVTAAAFLTPPAWGALTRPTSVGQCTVKLDPKVDPVRKAQVEGKVTIVEFLDFGCPFCQKLHYKLKPVLDEYGDQVVMVRKHWPIHREAIWAAIGGICADKLGKGNAMADELFATDDLSPDNIDKLAKKIGLDDKKFAECIKSDFPKNELKRVNKERKLLELKGLPSLFIGNECYQGVQTSRTIRASIERAKKRL